MLRLRYLNHLTFLLSLLCVVIAAPSTGEHQQETFQQRDRSPPGSSVGCQDSSFRHVLKKDGKGYECVRISITKHCSGYWVTTTDSKRKWQCCPPNKFYTFDTKNQMGGCCGVGEVFSVDPTKIKPTRKGSCCPKGHSFHWTNVLQSGRCCPDGTHLSAHEKTKTASCCSRGHAWDGTKCERATNPNCEDDCELPERGRPGEGDEKKPPICTKGSCSRGECCAGEVKETYYGDRVIAAFGPGDSWYFDIPSKVGTRMWNKIPQDLQDQFTRKDGAQVKQVYDLSLSPDGDACISYKGASGSDYWHITNYPKYKYMTEWYWWQGPGNHTNPGCVVSYNHTLGRGSTFYAKSSFGHRWSGDFHPKFHDVIQKRLGNCQRFAPTHVALGIKDSFVLVDKQGYFAWHLNQDYPTLHELLKKTKGGMLQYVALHPTVKDNYFILEKNGNVHYRVPSNMHAHVVKSIKLIRRVQVPANNQNIRQPRKPDMDEQPHT